MKIPYQIPDPSGTERAKAAKDFRYLASEIARLRPQVLTRTNGEESDYCDCYPTNFTKGLKHNDLGLVEYPEDYRNFVEAINSKDRTLFEKHVQSAKDRDVVFNCEIKNLEGNYVSPEWRGWESPRSGHVYELEGPDSSAVGMGPAPRVDSKEMAAEMAEVYALTLLRDVKFTDWKPDFVLNIHNLKNHLTPNDILKALNKIPYFNLSKKYKVKSSFERLRRKARFESSSKQLCFQSVFRGSTQGAKKGPYISQFMLIGNASLAKNSSGTSIFTEEEGLIAYGTQVIDQKVVVHKEHLDYATDWSCWLDIQNGANLKSTDQYETERRFICTPRDLATYVHFDALYQAYLNAALILLGKGTEMSRGFPEPSASGRRDAFATFGAPHVLSLVTEVATRCLKAVRRQKFNYHRRVRPEVIGGRLTLAAMGIADRMGTEAGQAFDELLNAIPSKIRKSIKAYNKFQNEIDTRCINVKNEEFPEDFQQSAFDAGNLLLPLAFPEGSPMHPSYGAGHATVAGGCVTMLKAFFEMFDISGRESILKLDNDTAYYTPNDLGTELVAEKKSDDKSNLLTIQGELDKLAANISLGRNMAGVHYYSDYYDSIRMGERIAVGILMEQAPTYGDEMEVSFTSFDGDSIILSGEAGTSPSLSVVDKEGNRVSANDWWLRHAIGEETILDM